MIHHHHLGDHLDGMRQMLLLGCLRKKARTFELFDHLIWQGCQFHVVWKSRLSKDGFLAFPMAIIHESCCLFHIEILIVRLLPHLGLLCGYKLNQGSLLWRPIDIMVVFWHFRCDVAGL
jgi:hypothetical protein